MFVESCGKPDLTIAKVPGILNTIENSIVLIRYLGGQVDRNTLSPVACMITRVNVLYKSWCIGIKYMHKSKDDGSPTCTC